MARLEFRVRPGTDQHTDDSLKFCDLRIGRPLAARESGRTVLSARACASRQMRAGAYVPGGSATSFQLGCILSDCMARRMTCRTSCPLLWTTLVNRRTCSASVHGWLNRFDMGTRGRGARAEAGGGRPACDCRQAGLRGRHVVSLSSQCRRGEEQNGRDSGRAMSRLATAP
jgi:hypothetical protein